MDLDSRLFAALFGAGIAAERYVSRFPATIHG